MYLLTILISLIALGVLFLLGRYVHRGPYQKWPLFYQLLAKWALITVICGGYSFFLGFMVSSMRVIPMLAAMAVTAFALAWFESRTRVVGIKEGFALLRRAMKYGTWFRIFWALMIPLSYLTGAVAYIKTWGATIIMFPAMSDGWIGIFVIQLFKIVGFNIERLGRSPQLARSLDKTPEWINQLGVFGISLTTAAIHVMILGILVLLIWGGLYVVQRFCHPRAGGDPSVQ